MKRTIKVPRGALTADAIAQTAEFFSFGTNDLTQTAPGICRHFLEKGMGGHLLCAPVRATTWATS